MKKLIDLALFVELSRVLKDAILAGAACIGAYVAISGLSAWKRQLKGKTEYEVAKDLLKATLQVRNRLQAARNPFFSSGQSQAEIFDVMRQAFEDRFAQVDEAVAQLEVSLLEAEALWGNAATEIFSEFHKCRAELIARINEYLWVENPNHPSWITIDRNPKRLDRLREIALALHSAEDDEYRKKLDRSIDTIRDYVRPHLK